MDENEKLTQAIDQLIAQFKAHQSKTMALMRELNNADKLTLCFEYNKAIDENLNNHLKPFVRQYYTELGENKPTRLYVAVFNGNGESFLKIGITADLTNRFANIPYECTAVLFNKVSNWKDCREIERGMLNELRGNKYAPKREFTGMSECYSHDALASIMGHLDSLEICDPAVNVQDIPQVVTLYYSLLSLKVPRFVIADFSENS